MASAFYLMIFRAYHCKILLLLNNFIYKSSLIWGDKVIKIATKDIPKIFLISKWDFAVTVKISGVGIYVFIGKAIRLSLNRLIEAIEVIIGIESDISLSILCIL